ncbi:hypothetical protein [Kribbella sp. CA-294648]
MATMLNYNNQRATRIAAEAGTTYKTYAANRTSSTTTTTSQP